MISNKKTIAIAGIAVLVLAVAGPILADILASHQADARFWGGWGRGWGRGWGGGWGGWGGGWGGGCCCGGGWGGWGW